MTLQHLRRTSALTGAAALLAIVLSGCSVPTNLFSGDAQRDDKGSVTDESNIDIFKLKVGDCKMEDSNSEQVSDTNVVPCDQPHDEEVFFDFTLPEGEFPGEDAITAATLEKCEPAFTTFVGKSEEDSALAYYPYYPTEQGWAELDDRLVQCVLYAEDASKLTGSMKGSNR